ncbi:MAG: J domain-containing protein [Anaerolineales bacterium]|nr:J domain-containing protein [Anaerolineales bacterium]
MTTAYPLQWPLGWPRTKYPKRARFDTSFASARDGLLDELRRLGARNVIISTNLELRLDGLPKAARRQPVDCGAAVYFVLAGQQQCIPCDRWNRIEDNLRAISLTVEALRGLERWGAKETVSAAFRGFHALPAPSPETWWDILELHPQATENEIRTAFRRLARLTHPDAGGDPDEFIKLQNAFEEALRLLD